MLFALFGVRSFFICTIWSNVLDPFSAVLQTRDFRKVKFTRIFSNHKKDKKDKKQIILAKVNNLRYMAQSINRTKENLNTPLFFCLLSFAMRKNNWLHRLSWNSWNHSLEIHFATITKLTWLTSWTNVFLSGYTCHPKSRRFRINS